MPRTDFCFGRAALLLVALSLPLTSWGGDREKPHDEEHDNADAIERVPVTEVPSAEAIVEINGLVCSFCAYGAEKAVRKLPFLDPKRFNSGVEVDINQHQMRLALNPDEPLDYKRLARSLRAGGYEPLDIYLRVRGTLEKRADGVVLAGSGVDYALEAGETTGLESAKTIEVLLRVDGRGLHEMAKGAAVPAALIRTYES